MPSSGISGSYNNTMFNFLREHHKYLLQHLCHFTFLPAMHKSSNFFTSSLILIFFVFLIPAILMSMMHLVFKYQGCFLSALTLWGNVIWIAMYSGKKIFLLSEINKVTIDNHFDLFSFLVILSMGLAEFQCIECNLFELLFLCASYVFRHLWKELNSFIPVNILLMNRG